MHPPFPSSRSTRPAGKPPVHPRTAWCPVCQPTSPWPPGVRSISAARSTPTRGNSTYLGAALFVDGSPIEPLPAYTLLQNPIYASVPLRAAVALSAGSHTFAVEWLSTSGSSSTIGVSGGSSLTVTAYNLVTPTTVHVDPNFGSYSFGQVIPDADPVAPGSQPAIFGLDAFTSVNSAVAAVAPGGTVIVDQGIYNEAVSISQQLTMNLQQGPITFGSLADTVNTASLNIGSGVTLTLGGNNNSTQFSSVISGSGNSATGLTLIKLGTGALTLSGAESYAGATVIQNGTLQLSSGANRLPTGTTITLGDSSNDSGVLDLGGQSQQLAGLLTAGTGAGNSVVNSGSGTPTLTLNLTSGTDTFGGILGGAGQNGFALTESGAGTLLLSARTRTPAPPRSVPARSRSVL